MRLIFFTISILLLSGCAELAYYTHAAGGQLEVVCAREPISKVIADPATDETSRKQLQLVQRARQFAISELAMPDSDTFRDYADLERPWVLWNVYATPELSLAPKQWCYPFVGCHDYRSYFSEAYAQEVAAELQQQGKDVYIAESPAYSTQGWFADPVYNPMLRYDDLTLVGILFHELAHERIYIINDSEMNESFATVVQNEGVRRWLEQGKRAKTYPDYLLDQERNEQFVDMMLEHREALQQLYASAMNVEQKRLEKKKIFSRAQKQYNKLKQQWDGYGGYDHWFETPLNNARLITIGTYHGYVSALQALLQNNNANLQVFYQEVERLAALPKEERRRQLDALLP